MLKIANSPVGKCCVENAPTVSYLPFSGVTHTYLTEATNAALLSSLQSFVSGNPTKRIITRTPMTGMDGVTGLLLEHTDEATAEVVNSLLSSTYVTGETTVAQLAAIQTWKTANPDLKIVALTPVTGNDGENGHIIEYSGSNTVSAIKNSKISQTYFADGALVDDVATTDYDQYATWKAENTSYRPLRISKMKGSDDSGLYVEYTTQGSFPTGATLEQIFIDEETGGPGVEPDDGIQNWKDDNITKSIIRITTVTDGVLVEYMSGGSTPQNMDVTESYYQGSPANTDANSAYQTFKSANPTLIPIRLTHVVWGDGSSGLIAEYINP